MRDKSAQGRRNRTRGASSERELVSILKEFWPGAMRGIQSQGHIAACDVENTPLRIECKHRASHGCIRFLETAEEEAQASADDRPVIVALREQGNKHWCVLLRLDSLMDIAKSILPQDKPKKKS